MTTKITETKDELKPECYGPEQGERPKFDPSVLSGEALELYKARLLSTSKQKVSKEDLVKTVSKAVEEIKDTNKRREHAEKRASERMEQLGVSQDKVLMTGTTREMMDTLFAVKNKDYPDVITLLAAGNKFDKIEKDLGIILLKEEDKGDDTEAY